MTGWIVYDSNQYQKNEWFANKLLKYCKNFCNAKLIIVERLQFGIDEDGYYICYDNEPLQKPDFVLMRSIFPLLSFFLEQLKIRVFNNYQTSKLCNDKRLTYLSVKKSQVPIMDTMFFNRDFFDVKNIQLYNIDYPIILKSASGHGGTEVFLIKNTEYLQHIVSSLDKPDFLIQKIFYPFGKDLRVYVLGGKIIASVLRMSEGIKSNYSLGGKAHYYQLNSLEQKLVNDLLVLARTDGRTEKSAKKEVDIAKLLKKREQLIVARLGDKKIRMDLPEKANAKIAESDFAQIVDILLDNAVKYSKTKIEVFLVDGVLTVKNDGKTIPAEKLTKVFDRFYQTDKTAEGSGLGLAIAKAVAERNGWKIRAESDKKTTSFILEF